MVAKQLQVGQEFSMEDPSSHQALCGHSRNEQMLTEQCHVQQHSNKHCLQHGLPEPPKKHSCSLQGKPMQQSKRQPTAGHWEPDWIQHVLELHGQKTKCVLQKRLQPQRWLVANLHKATLPKPECRSQISKSRLQNSQLQPPHRCQQMRSAANW